MQAPKHEGANPVDYGMTLGMDPQQLARLVHAAVRAPSDVHELRTDSGTTVRIEREPEPGVEYRLFAPENADWEVILARATDARPTRYPADLPFVQNATAVVARSGRQQMVTWNQAGDLAGFRELMRESDGLVEDPAILEAQERIQPLLERAREGDVGARGALRDEAAIARAAAKPETREKMRQMWDRLQPAPERLKELERIYETVLDATERDGWERIDSTPEADGAFRTKNATYRRGDIERAVGMAVSFGPISSVMLWERAPE